jgi:hypothetical protein
VYLTVHFYSLRVVFSRMEDLDACVAVARYTMASWRLTKLRCCTSGTQIVGAMII